MHKMEKEFFGTAVLERSIVYRKKDILNNKINWLKMREIEVIKEKPFSIFFKNDFGAETQEIDLEKKRGRPFSEEL